MGCWQAWVSTEFLISSFFGDDPAIFTLGMSVPKNTIFSNVVLYNAVK